MSTVFFGGIGRYYFDGNGQLWDDVNVPFVNTISRWYAAETAPCWKRRSAPCPRSWAPVRNSSLRLMFPRRSTTSSISTQLEGDTVLAGHIVGGIESSAANIFFINTGTQSDASTRVFQVLLVRDINTGVGATDVEAVEEVIGVSLSPDTNS